MKERVGKDSLWRKYSPESPVKENVQGKDPRQLKHAWRAQWITHPTDSTLDYGVFLFRKEFSLQDKPLRFVIFVSADNRYRLYVNGTEVCFGPAAGDLEHYRYETLDIASYLKKGKNVLAAEVVNFGEYRRAAQQTFQTAFILQNYHREEGVIDTGSPGWKVIRNDAYRVIPFLPSDMKAYYCAGPGDRLEGSRYPWGWEREDYDDSHWLTPRPATVEFAAGRGFLFGSTWFLVPRKIPMMELRPQRFRRIVRTTGAEDIHIPESFPQRPEPFVLPPHTTVSVLFDHGVHTVAFPALHAGVGGGSRIKITYAEALFKKTEAGRDDFRPEETDLKGNRNDTEGKEIFGVYDLFFPDGGENRIFRPLWKRTFRYVQLDIETKEEPLTIYDFTSVFMGYPFKQKARFKTDDPLLSRIWEVAWRTLRNGADETFQDSPYYEQLQYIGDARVSALVSLYVSGDDRLMRKAIEHFDDSRIPEGLTQSRYPAYIKQIIPPFSLIWVDMIHDYLMYRDDPSFVEKFLPGIWSVLQWFSGRVDEKGMLTGLEWWSFTDWVSVFPNGVPPGADHGYSANINLQYVYALRNAEALFRHFGRKTEAGRCNDLAERIVASVQASCYDPAAGLFAETPDKKIFTRHTNAMAVLADAVEEKQQREIMLKILKNEKVVKATLYFKFYIFRALQKAGLGSEYLGQLASWKKMLSDGLTTFAEKDVNPRSDCHPWSSSPCFDFLHTVAGITPAGPGFKKISVAPNFGYLKIIDARMPHPGGGMIEVILEKNGKEGVKGYISLPKGSSGYFIWKNTKYPLKPGRQEIDY